MESPQGEPLILAVTRLMLTDFRCYGMLRMDADTRPVVLTGLNGAGKTNILEALSFLTPGRGLRRAKLSEIARHEIGAEAPWAVAATIRRDGEVIQVGSGREQGSERRLVRIDGEPAKTQSALAGILSAVWLTPAMDRLFLESAGGRRRFLDRLVLGFDDSHGARATAYEHAMRERTKLLKAAAAGNGRLDPAWLSLLEATMAEKGVALAAARRSVAARLDDACRQGIGPFPAAGLTVSGSIEGWLDETGEAEAEDRFKALLAGARRRDQAAGAATEGPHRSDFKVRHRAKDMPAELCSTGEQKALLVSVVLAQGRVRAAEKGMAPMLLLDEVAAHLDEVRREALYDELCAMGAQSWMTGTDRSMFSALGDRAQFFRVHEGSVTPEASPGRP